LLIPNKGADISTFKNSASIFSPFGALYAANL